jgi:hypothetical protein
MGSEYRELVLGEEFMDLLRDPKPAPAAASSDVEAHGEALEANLRAQLALYREYAEAAGRQRLAMVNGGARSADINAEIEPLLAALGSLESDRISLVEKILAARPGTAADPAKVKCEILYPFFGPDLALRIQAARASLLQAVAELKRVLEVNRALVENGSRIIHTTIGIMTSVVGRGKADRMSATYTKKGAVNVGKVQVRNLFNRSV